MLDHVGHVNLRAIDPGLRGSHDREACRPDRQTADRSVFVVAGLLTDKDNLRVGLLRAENCLSCDCLSTDGACYSRPPPREDFEIRILWDWFLGMVASSDSSLERSYERATGNHLRIGGIVQIFFGQRLFRLQAIN